MEDEYKNGDFDTIVEALEKKPYLLEYHAKELATIELRDWLAKEDLLQRLLRWFVYNSKDFDILIDTNLHWLDDTDRVYRLIKQNNKLYFIEGCIENNEFVPVQKTEYGNVDKFERVVASVHQ